MSRIIDLDAVATQSGFAAVVGISQQAVSDAVSRGVIAAGGTYAEWLLAYSAHMREQAAGRGGDDQGNLTKQRARQASADADLKELDYLERVQELIAVKDFEPQLAAWAVAIRSEFENAVARIVALIESKHGIEIDNAAVDDIVCAALDAASAYPRVGREDAAQGRGAAEEAEEDLDA